MKTVNIIITALLLQNIAVSQQRSLHQFTLTGDIIGKDSGYVYLNYIPAGENGILDSCKVKNGHFVISGYITEPTKAFFTTFGFTGNPDENNVIDFYIEPTDMKLSATINHFKTLKLTGSKSDDEFRRLRKSMVPIFMVINANGDSIRKYTKELQIKKINSSDSARVATLTQKKDSLSNLQTILFQKSYFLDSAFIAENLNSYVSADLLADSKSTWMAFSSFENLYKKLAKRIQESFPGKQIRHQIEKENHIHTGVTVSNFVATDSKGDTISLTAYKGKKYVLLDFGASWCAPCRRIIPFLKKEYAKYDTAFEIISIANQEQEDDWRNAIKKDEVTWPQIIENKKTKALEPSDKSITDMYWVDQTPALILIDKNSKIVGKFGAFFSSNSNYLLDLNEQLNKIFGKN